MPIPSGKKGYHITVGQKVTKKISVQLNFAKTALSRTLAILSRSPASSSAQNRSSSR